MWGLILRPRCCIAHAAPGELEHVITDQAGKAWRFEMHRICGPIVLRADGQPKARQPGSRSPFWPAFEAWQLTNQMEQSLERLQPNQTDHQ